jgi:hypothetical protein
MRTRVAAAGGRGVAAGIAIDEASFAGGRFDFGNDMFARVPETCWPDYAVQ